MVTLHLNSHCSLIWQAENSIIPSHLSTAPRIQNITYELTKSLLQFSFVARKYYTA